MKKAFTIIEIVMVMIILVVLASLAVPKLITKKVDAQVAKAAISMKMHINKVSTYYIINGEFATSSSGGGVRDNAVDFWNMVRKWEGDKKQIADKEVIVGKDDYKYNEEYWKNEEYIWGQCLIPNADNNNGLISFKQQPLSNIYDQYKTFCIAFFAHPTIKELVQNGVEIGNSRVFRK